MTDQHQLYEIAETQNGYFTAAQVRRSGYSHPSLSYHTRPGTFQQVAHGIYRLTCFPPTPHEELFVAWLRTGLALDETPVPNSSLRSPRVPDEERIWLSFGATYRYSPEITASPPSCFLRSRFTSSARRMSIFPCRMRRR